MNQKFRGNADTSTRKEIVIPPQERDTWNIELSLDHVDDTRIYIHVVDRDNIGFHQNEKYYLLEYYDSDKWVTINDMSGISPYAYDSFVVAQEKGYVASLLVCSKTNVLDGFEFKTGRYRATFVFNDKPFSCEFDLNFD